MERFILSVRSAVEGRSRAALAALFLALPLIGIAAALFAHPAQSALFATPLHPEQLDEVEERLAGWNVPFTPTQENVLVDARRRSDVLLRLSLAGVPHAHLTGENEALASVGALTPQSVIDAQALDGRADDIASSLRDVAGVQDARVIIAPAKSAEFADESASAATASVRLRLDPGVRLSGETVSGIADFVAAAVPGLVAARVMILDDRGLALGAAGSGDEDATGVQAALQSALDAAFGAGTTIVRVRTDRASTSTAVFVDTAHAGDLLAIRDLAAATVGYNAPRGDALAVQAVDFARLPSARKDAWWLLYGSIVPLLPTLACVAGALVAVRVAAPPVVAAAQHLAQRLRLDEAKTAAPEMPPARVRSMLEAEPPHAAAAVISALPAATAAAVLELYPPHERQAIVQRMHRPPPPLAPDPSEFLRRG